VYNARDANFVIRGINVGIIFAPGSHPIFSIVYGDYGALGSM